MTTAIQKILEDEAEASTTVDGASFVRNRRKVGGSERSRTTDFRTGHAPTNHQRPTAGPEQGSRTDQRSYGIHATVVGAGEDTAAAIDDAQSREPSPLPPDSPNGHPASNAHQGRAVGGEDTATPANEGPDTKLHTPGVAGEQGQPAKDRIGSTHDSLADPTLALAADVLDDLERTRIANENRLRQLTRDETDTDGEERGFGLTEHHPDVARLAAIVSSLAEIEHQATLNLQRAMRKHPLGPWVKAQKGVGEKQAARLLAAIGDPFWNYLHDRPRTVSELWAYCGLHTLPAGQRMDDSHDWLAGGASSPSGDQTGPDTQRRFVAARRRKGERANWSTTAKMRAWNIAESMLKAGNRETYDKRKAATEGRVHAVACVRCGPSGKPAQPGTAWSDAHRHADALRIVSKELLKQLWRAARDIHLGQSCVETQAGCAEVEQPQERAA